MQRELFEQSVQEENAEKSSGARSIAELMMGRFEIKKSTGGVNSAFNDAVARVVETITDQKWTFARWCGVLRGIPPQKIHQMLGSAKQSKNTGRHFNWQVKEYRKDEKLTRS